MILFWTPVVKRIAGELPQGANCIFSYGNIGVGSMEREHQTGVRVVLSFPSALVRGFLAAEKKANRE